MSKTDEILEERGNRYGDFTDIARFTQMAEAKLAELDQRSGQNMTPRQREAARMILQKLARAAAGDPNYADNWDDIAGYAQLALNLESKQP